MPKKKQILYPVIFMVGLTALFTFLLAFVNNVTEETIETQRQLEIQKSVMYVFDINTENLTDDEIKELFDTYIETDIIQDQNIYTYISENKVNGYAFDFIGKGLWGTITGHLALSPDHSKILGVNFTSHSETPGLGGRIDELEFKEPFRNIDLSGRTEYIIYRPKPNANIDAISGATLTSLSIKEILDTSIPRIIEFASKEGFYEGN